MSTDVRTDLRTLERMLEDLEPYLLSTVTFWPLGGAGLPQLSLGQLFLVLRRLSVIKEAQGPVEAVERMLAKWHSAAARKVDHELPQRVRLWHDHLADLEIGTGRAPFASDVSQRVIIELMVERFPELAHTVAGLEVPVLDTQLRAIWRAGASLWPGTEPIFARERYWFLYGAPEAAQHPHR